MAKVEHLIVPKGSKFTGSGKLGLTLLNLKLGLLASLDIILFFYLFFHYPG